jgi:hypothetical protein
MDDQRVIFAQLNVEHFRALLTTEPKGQNDKCCFNC